VECQEARVKMFSYLDQELSATEEEALFDHLSLCHECSLEFSTATETHSLLKDALVPAEPPHDLMERIMARIPIPCEEKEENTAGFGLRLKEFLLDLGGRWKNALGSRQFRTAVVTLGLFALVVYSTDVFDLQLTQKPDTNVAHVEPKDTEVTDSEPADQVPTQENPIIAPQLPEENNDPNTEGEESPGEDISKEQENSPDIAPEVGKPTKVVPDRDTNIVELPQAASAETKEETIKIVPLIENNSQRMSHPVLSQDGRFVHYLYDNAGVEEEWEIELKPGAQPQKAQISLVSEAAGNGKAQGTLPPWLNEMEMIKDAKSKVVAWSPDMKQIAVNLDAAGSEYDGLWITQPDGAAMAQATQEGGGNDLVWSPNRMKIAFTDASENLYVLYIRENVLIQVSDSSEGLVNLNHLFWTPDGQELIFEGQNEADGQKSIYRVALP
jgi:hypothetical protein